MKVLIALAGALFAACATSTGAPDGSGGVDGPVCSDDVATPDAALQVGPASDASGVWCGGEIAFGGVTPFGVFSPTAIAATVGPPSDEYLDVTLAENPTSASPGQQLTFRVALNPDTQTYDGTYNLTGFIEEAGQVMPVAVVADVTTADAPYTADGGHADAGAARIVVTVATDCGALSGTLVVHYCEWQV
jgi:hypothetical protein